MASSKQVREVKMLYGSMVNLLELTGTAFEYDLERFYTRAIDRIALLEAANDSAAELERHISMIHRNYISEL